MTDELRKAADELADAVYAWWAAPKGTMQEGDDADHVRWCATAYRAAAKKEDDDAARKADAARRRTWR